MTPPLKVLVALTLVIGVPPTSANPADLYGLGARVPGMGGAGTAVSSDTMAGYYNPAALGFFQHLRLDLGYQYAKPTLRLNDRDTEVDTSRGLSAGIALPGQIGGVRFGVGGTFYLPDRYYYRTRSLESGLPRFQLFDNRAERFALGFNVGVSWHDRIAIGGGISYMADTVGDVGLAGRVGFPDADDSDLRQSLDVDIKTVVYPQLGVLVRATSWLDVGLSYTGEYELNIDLTLNVHGSIGASGVDPVVEDGFLEVVSLSRDHYQPARFHLGIAARPLDDVLVAFDLGYHRWSGFENPATRLTIDYDLGDFNDDIELEDQLDLPIAGFDDIWVPRLGVEWRALRRDRVDAFVRGGYKFEPSPTSEQTGVENFVDNDKHTVSFGTGVTLREITEIIPLPFSIDAYLAFMVLPSRTHRKSMATDPIGDYTSRGTVLQAGMSSSWRF